MSYLTQMAGLAWHNFTSAAAGIAVALVIARGLTRRARSGRRRRRSAIFGSTWSARMVYLLLPISAVVRLGAGRAGRDPELCALPGRHHGRRGHANHGHGAGRLARGDQGARHQRRRLLQRQQRPSVRESRRRSPTFSRWCSIFAIPAGLTYTLGRMAGDQRQGWAMFGAMAVLFVVGVDGGLLGRIAAAIRPWPICRSIRPWATWKARRFASASPTRRCSPPSRPTPRAAPSTAMHDSFTPLGGLVPLVNIQLGEVDLRRRRRGPVWHAGVRAC